MSQAFTIEEVLWQDDLALFRSLDGEIPWAQRFGSGQVKVLAFDLKTQAATYLFKWPAGYDPLGAHAHGGPCVELILSGSLVQENRDWPAGTFFSTEPGEAHGPFTAGPDGCVFLVHCGGPLFEDQFKRDLLEQGKAARHRL